MVNERLDYLDYVKGFAILLVVLAHIYAYNSEINRELIVVWIYSFHMPLFFIVSGMLIRHKGNYNVKNFIISKVKHILIPYIIFSLCNSIIKIILYGFNASNFILDIIYTFTLIGVDTWFLQTLFLAEIVFILLKKYIKNDYIILMIIGVLFVGSLFITKDIRFLFVFMARVFISLGFLATGYYLYKFINNRNLSVLLLTILLLGQIVLSKFNGFVDLNNIVFNNKLLYVVNSILGAIVVIMIFKSFIIKSRVLKYCGINTLVIFATHGNIIYLFRRFISSNLHGYISGLFLFGIIMLVEIPIIYIINNYFPWILGRKRFKENLKLEPV